MNSTQGNDANHPAFASLSLAATKPRPRPISPRATALVSNHRTPRHAIPPVHLAHAENVVQLSGSKADTRTHKVSNPASAARSVPSQGSSLVGALLARLAGSGSATDAPSSTCQTTSRMFPSLLPCRGPAANTQGPIAAGARKPAVVWFRSDLRLHDHEPLALANRHGTSVLPVYCFDPRQYGKNASGFDRSGPYRARFILDSVAELRERLRQAGSELLVRVGRPEEVLPRLVAEVGGGAVYCHCEVTYEELQVERAVRAALQKEGAELHGVWGNSLYHPDDLPFSLQQLPGNYAEFKRKLGQVAVRGPVEAPGGALKSVPLGGLEGGELPSMLELGFSAEMLERCERDRSVVAGLKGGETQALQQLQAFIADISSRVSPPTPPSASPSPSPSAAGPASAANPSTSFSCRISPWLATGCLSPRQMYDEVSRHFREAAARTGQPVPAPGGGGGGGSDRPAAWLLYELMWRDFFKMITRKYSLAIVGPGQKGAAGAGQGQVLVGV